MLYVPAGLYSALPEQDRYQIARMIENLVQKHDTASYPLTLHADPYYQHAVLLLPDVDPSV